MSQRADAASDRCSYTASAPPNPATAFTAVFWARLRVDRDDFSTMMRLHSSSGGSTAVNIATGSSGTTPIVVSPGNTGGIIGTDALAVDTWRMIAVTCAGTGATDSKIYTKTIGGSTNVVTGQVSGGAAPDGITLFGRSAGDSTEWFNGGQAYVRIYSAVLSQAEIEAEWASATAVRTSDRWADWPLINNLNDVSGNGRHLTAGTTALSTEDNPPIGEVRVVLDLAAESDTAHAVTPAHVVPLALASEADTAHQLAITHVVALQLASETDTAHPVTPAKVVVLDQAVELDTAHDITRTKVVPLGLAVEVDTALPITVGGALLVPGTHTATSSVGNLSASSAVSGLEAT